MYIDLNTQSTYLYTGSNWQQIAGSNPILICKIEFISMFKMKTIVNLYANHTMVMIDEKTGSILSMKPNVIIKDLKTYLSINEWQQYEKYILECVG
jgi:hypothetical protein